jgi:hypothetical protein
MVNQISILAWSLSQSNLVNSSQPWLTLVKIYQTLLKCAPDHVLRDFLCILITFGSNSAQSSWLVLRVDIRENSGGKNKVMTLV